MQRFSAAVFIAAVAPFLAACEPVASLKNPRWEPPDYSTTHSGAYYQHDPLYTPNRGGP